VVKSAVFEVWGWEVSVWNRLNFALRHLLGLSKLGVARCGRCFRFQSRRCRSSSFLFLPARFGSGRLGGSFFGFRCGGLLGNGHVGDREGEGRGVAVVEPLINKVSERWCMLEFEGTRHGLDLRCFTRCCSSSRLLPPRCASLVVISSGSGAAVAVAGTQYLTCCMRQKQKNRPPSVFHCKHYIPESCVKKGCGIVWLVTTKKNSAGYVPCDHQPPVCVFHLARSPANSAGRTGIVRFVQFKLPSGTFKVTSTPRKRFSNPARSRARAAVAVSKMLQSSVSSEI